MERDFRTGGMTGSTGRPSIPGLKRRWKNFGETPKTGIRQLERVIDVRARGSFKCPGRGKGFLRVGRIGWRCCCFRGTMNPTPASSLAWLWRGPERVASFKK